MEKNNYLISEMKIEDLENIKDILETDFDEFWNYETLKEELESNFSKYFIAKQNDNIVGFAGLKIILDEADLMNIVTKKCCRHEGIAIFIKRSEEHTSELQSLVGISYAVFCLKKKFF